MYTCEYVQRGRRSKLARNPVDQVIMGGAAVGSGMLLSEVQRQTALAPTTALVVSLGTAAAGIGITMVSRDEAMRAIGDGLAGGSLGWAGNRLHGMLVGNQVQARQSRTVTRSVQLQKPNQNPGGSNVTRLPQRRSSSVQQQSASGNSSQKKTNNNSQAQVASF